MGLRGKEGSIRFISRSREMFSMPDESFMNYEFDEELFRRGLNV